MKFRNLYQKIELHNYFKLFSVSDFKLDQMVILETKYEKIELNITFKRTI